MLLTEGIINFYGAMTSYSQWNHQSIVEHDDWVLSWKSIHAPSLEKTRWVKTYGSGDQTFCWKSRTYFWVHFFSQIHWKFPTIFGGRRVETGFGQNSHNNLTRNCLDLGLIITFRTGNIFFDGDMGMGQSHLLPYHRSSSKSKDGVFLSLKAPCNFHISWFVSPSSYRYL